MAHKKQDEQRRRFLLLAGAGGVGAALMGGCGPAAQEASPPQDEEPSQQPIEPRRVVTGHDAEGTSVVKSQGPPTRDVAVETAGGVRLVELWATDETPQIPVASGDPVLDMTSFTPGVSGSRFRLVEFPPGSEPAQLDARAVLEEVQEKAPGDWNFEEDAPGMHTTDTIDYGVVISGEIALVLGDGATVNLTQGDCVVQTGTRHAWLNSSAEPCWMAFVMIGAERSRN